MRSNSGAFVLVWGWLVSRGEARAHRAWGPCYVAKRFIGAVIAALAIRRRGLDEGATEGWLATVASSPRSIPAIDGTEQFALYGKSQGSFFSSGSKEGASFCFFAKF